jgi:hypothetical protein
VSRRTLLLAFAACGSDPSPFDVVDCSLTWRINQEVVDYQCELACEQKPYNQDEMPNGEPEESCVAWNPVFGYFEDGQPHVSNCERVFYTGGALGKHRGCCGRGDDLIQFKECCRETRPDGGLPTYECPE